MKNSRGESASEALVRALAVAQRVYDSDPAQGSQLALEAVYELLVANGFTVVELKPLHRLNVALQDLIAGAKPEILKARVTTKTRATSLDDNRLAVIAAVCEVARRFAGVSTLSEAAQIASRRLKLHGVNVTSARVQKIREQIKSGTRYESARSRYRTMVDQAVRSTPNVAIDKLLTRVLPAITT